MTVFLDTDICISILRGKDPALEAQLRSVPLSSVELPSVVVAELWVGVGKSNSPEIACKRLEVFLRNFRVVAFDEECARKYGEIRSDLEKKGLTIGSNDLLIAATVLTVGGKLVTRNLREYQSVRNLKIEAW